MTPAEWLALCAATHLGGRREFTAGHSARVSVRLLREDAGGFCVVAIARNGDRRPHPGLTDREAARMLIAMDDRHQLTEVQL